MIVISFFAHVFAVLVDFSTHHIYGVEPSMERWAMDLALVQVFNGGLLLFLASVKPFP